MARFSGWLRAMRPASYERQDMMMRAIARLGAQITMSEQELISEIKAMSDELEAISGDVDALASAVTSAAADTALPADLVQAITDLKGKVDGVRDHANQTALTAAPPSAPLPAPPATTGGNVADGQTTQPPQG